MHWLVPHWAQLLIIGFAVAVVIAMFFFQD